MTKYLILMVSLIGLTSLNGCIGGEPAGEPLSQTTANTVLNNLTTQVFNKLPTSNAVPSLPVTGATTSSKELQTRATNCYSVTPATIVDADGDSIAVEKTYTYDCEDEFVTDTTYSQKGFLTVKDKDDTVAGLLGGVRVDFGVSAFRHVDGSGNETNNTFNGFWDYSFANGILTSEAEFSGSYYFNSSSNDYENDFSYTYDWTYQMIPDDEANVFTSGQIEFNGEFVMEGKFVIEVDNKHQDYEEGRWKISYYSEDLTYDTTCTKYYNTGSFKMEDGSGSIYEIKFMCTTAEFYINGEKSTLYNP